MYSEYNFVVYYLELIQSINLYIGLGTSKTIPNNHFANFTTEYPGENIFLAKFYVYFGVEDYCLSIALLQVFFS